MAATPPVVISVVTTNHGPCPCCGPGPDSPLVCCQDPIRPVPLTLRLLIDVPCLGPPVEVDAVYFYSGTGTQIGNYYWRACGVFGCAECSCVTLIMTCTFGAIYWGVAFHAPGDDPDGDGNFDAGNTACRLQAVKRFGGPGTGNYGGIPIGCYDPCPPYTFGDVVGTTSGSSETGCGCGPRPTDNQPPLGTVTLLYCPSADPDADPGEGARAAAVEPEPAAPPCRHLDDTPLLAGKADALGLPVLRTWRACELGHGVKGHVCGCADWPAGGCKGCPDYAAGGTGDGDAV